MANMPIKSLKVNGSTYDFVDNEARETKADITYVNKTHYGYSGNDLLIIPEGTTTIADNAYRGTNYKCVAIPNSVTSIGLQSFDHCRFLTSITIPDSVTSIGDYAFSNCWDMTSITIGNGVTSIRSYAFSSCGLTSITIPNSVTIIGNSAFSYCQSLTSITIPNSVTIIGNSAFGYCTSLTSITIGNGVTSIGNSAFISCPLTTIDLTAYTTQSFPTLDTNNFNAITSDCQIKVVKGRKAELSAMTNWSAYASYIVEVPTVETVDAELSDKAPRSHASSSTTYGASSASNYGHAMASSTTPKANGTAAVGSETAKFARGDHVHPLQTTVSGNAGTATKLATARSISLGTGATGTATNFDGSANITIPVTSVKEAYLSWGGKNFSGSYGCIDAAMIPELGANRLAFMPSAGVVIEYSRNGGSTWIDYGASADTKINLFNGIGSNARIGADSTKGIDKSSYMVRVTINTSAAQVYTELNKFVIYCSTEGSSGSYCTIQARLQSNYESGTETWKTLADKVGISGWSGYNVINISPTITYGNSKSSQYGQIRFTFGVTSHASSVAYAGLNIIKIYGFGGAGWTTPSTMAKTGRMYTYDSGKNVTFPAAVTATGFSGPLTGNATTASGIKDSANSSTITASYASAQLAYSDITHLACWNGYQLRAINKSEFAKANHTHSYLPLSGGTLTGKLTIGSTDINKDLDVKGNIACKNLSAEYVGASGGSIYAAHFYTENPNNGGEAVHIDYDGTITTSGSIVLNNDGGTLTGISNSKGTSSTIAASQKCLNDNYLPLSGGTLTGNVTVNAGKSIQLNTLKIPTSSGGSTYGVGSSGQVLKSNGTTVYWAEDNNTHYTAYNYVGAADSASNAATTNGSTYLKLYENGSKRSQFKITGSGATTVSSDANGNITISSTAGTIEWGTF